MKEVNKNMKDIIINIQQLTLCAKIGTLKYIELHKLQKEFEKYCEDLFDLNEKENI